MACALKRTCPPRSMGPNDTIRTHAAVPGRQELSSAQIVQDVLARIRQTDGGLAMSQAEQSTVNDCLDELERRGQDQQPRPLDNPDIYGDYDVAYTSTQRAPRQDGQPSGGRFRGKLGRRIFKTTKLCQSILQPDIVVNKVEFELLGLWKGYVGLRGQLQAQGENRDTVKVQFEPPRLHLGNAIDVAIGPRSSVVLTTTYLSPDVRIGKGSRGSLFVFTRGGDSANAGMSKVGLERTSAAGWGILAVLNALLLAAVNLLWKLPSFGKATILVPLLPLLFLLQAVFRSLSK